MFTEIFLVYAIAFKPKAPAEGYLIIQKEISETACTEHRKSIEDIVGKEIPQLKCFRSPSDGLRI